MKWNSAIRMKATVLLTVGLAAVAFAQTSHLVVFKDTVVSRDIRVINGRPYVPLADMAKALGGFAVKTASGYRIKTKDEAKSPEAQSAGPAKGLSGSVGDTLSDGKWRLQVSDYQVVDSYTIRREGGIDAAKVHGNAHAQGQEIDAEPDYSLVIVNCRLTNGQKMPEAFGSSAGRDTALFDEQGTSYPVVGWDQDGGLTATKRLAPGAGDDVSAIFLVPFGTRLHHAVFSLTNVSDTSSHDVTVSLEPGGANGT